MIQPAPDDLTTEGAGAPENQDCELPTLASEKAIVCVEKLAAIQPSKMLYIFDAKKLADYLMALVCEDIGTMNVEPPKEGF